MTDAPKIAGNEDPAEVVVVSKSRQIRSDVAGLVKDDLIGISDWKRSKIGTLTGFSPAARAFRSLGSNVANSTSHLNGLFEGIMAREPLPSLPDELMDAEDTIRFEAAFAQQGMTETKIAAGIRNTFWSTYLFGGASLMYIVLVVYWNLSAPPRDAVVFLMRLGFLPFILALCFKHSYTNWILRNRKLPKYPLKFLRSLEFLPRQK